MALNFDGPARRIVLSAGTTALSVRDLWSRWVDWQAQDDHAKFLPALATIGGEPIDAAAGTRIPVYAFLRNGWRIRPQEASHTLTVGDGIVLVEGGGDPFVNPPGGHTVRINYQQPVQAIAFDAGGGGGLTPVQAAQLEALALVHGLVHGLPLVVTAASRSAGELMQSISEAGGVVTVARQ